MKFMATSKVFEVEEVGVFKPKMEKTDKLSAGEVGYVAANIKEVRDAKVGDTLTEESRPTAEPLPGFKDVLPMVFCGLYPVQLGGLRRAERGARKTETFGRGTFLSNPRLRRPFPSVFAVASWGFCTWKSFRNGWNGNMT